MLRRVTQEEVDFASEAAGEIIGRLPEEVIAEAETQQEHLLALQACNLAAQIQQVKLLAEIRDLFRQSVDAPVFEDN